MDQGSGAGNSTPAAVSSSVESAITNQSTELETRVHPDVFIRRPTDYRVADLFGRFFLRVCYWVDVFSTIKRRGEPLAFVPFPQAQAASLPVVEAAKQRIGPDAGTTAPGTPVASA